MAFPTILFNSVTGTVLSSGAGPSTALSGSVDASTDGTGLIVTLTAGTDLTNVSTLGDHVIFLNDATAGNRNFGSIINKAGSGGATPTVTVSSAFGAGLAGKDWAIGGIRKAIGATEAKKLFDNNGASGDAMPGWIMEMQSGHTETIAATFDIRRAGDRTSGPITLRGAAGAVTLPILTFSNNGNAIVMRNNYWFLQDFEMRNTNATKTASVAMIGAGSGSMVTVNRVVIAHSTDKFWKAITPANSGWYVRDCNIGFCAATGIETMGLNCRVVGNWIHDCTSHGINNASTSAIGLFFCGNLVETNGGDGFHFTDTGANDLGGGYIFIGNTIAYNTGDGIEFAQNNGTLDRPMEQMLVINNIFANNGGWGLNLSGTGWTDTSFATMEIDCTYNDFFTNSAGALGGSGSALTLPATNSTLDPQFVDQANADYAIGTNVAALGFPGSRNIGANLSSTKSYRDIGVAQRQAGGGSGYLLVAP